MEMYTSVPTSETIEQTASALRKHGFLVEIAETAQQAKDMVVAKIPEQSEVMTMSSETLTATGISELINESGKYNAVKSKLMTMDRKTQGSEMQKLGAAPQWAIGSVHAVTETGEVLIASNTGSQLSAYVYGSAHVIWVVGAQKIVPDLASGLKRIYEYVLPLESKRVQKAYGMPHSAVNKLLIVNQEIQKERITILLVRESLGF